MFNTVKKLAKSVARNWTRPQMVRVNRRPKLAIVTKPAPAPVINYDALYEAVEMALLTLSDAANEYEFGEVTEQGELIGAAKQLGFPEVADFSEEQLQALAAAVCEDVDNNVPTISEIAESVQAIEHWNYALLEDVDTWNDLGDEIAGRFIDCDCDRIWDYIDTESLGEDYAREYNGRFTRHGYFQLGSIE